LSHRSRTTPRPFGPPAASASRPIAAAVAALLGLVTALVGIPLSATAAPVIVYTQTFASAPTTGWTSGGQPWAAAGGKYTADASGFTNLPALNYSLASLALSTAGYSDVEVRFDYSATDLAGESLLVNYANNSGGYSTVLSQSTDTAETSTGWVALTGASDHAGFVLQFSLVGNGVSAPAAVTIDNLEIRGEVIVVDTTDPTATLVSPADGTEIPSYSTDYTVTVGDDVSSPADVTTSYRFGSVASPSTTIAYSAVPDGAGETHIVLTRATLAGLLSLVEGDQFTLTIDLVDEAGNSASVLVGTFYYLSDTPAPVAPAITSGAPAAGVVGQAYSHSVTATGTPAPTFAVSSGSLPAGLSLNTVTGEISGTPTTAGTSNFDVTVSNGTLPNDSASYSIEVAAVPSITWTPPLELTVGVAFSETVTTTGTAPITFAVTAGTLPAGLVLNAGSGLLSGTPTTVETAAFTLTATNSAGSDSLPVSIEVEPTPAPPAITSLAPADGTVGVAYSHTVTATGVPDPSFAVSSGALPAGLSLGASTGVISGTPTAVGSSTFEITASNGVGSDDVESYTIVVAPAPVAPAIVSADPADGVVGFAYSHTFVATGGGTMTYTVTSGALPSGLSLVGGVLSGTPTAAGSSTFEVTASNGVGSDAVESYTIEVVTVPTISGTPPTATVDIIYAYTPTLGGSGPFAVALTAGALPTGLTVDPSTGEISGEPLGVPGTYSFTLTVSTPGAPSATWATAIELEHGDPSNIVAIQAGGQTVAPGGTLHVDVGESLTFAVTGADFSGNQFDITSDVVLTSDVASDVVTGSTIEFPTASPHVITVQWTGGPLVADVTVEVAAEDATAAGTEAAAELGATGADPVGWLVSAAALLLLGAVLVTRSRAHSVSARR